MSEESSARTTLPPRDEIVRAAERLWSQGDVRSYITLVETWRGIEDIPEPLLLNQVRALLDLCQTDRAWTRLEEFAEGEEPSVEVLKLVVRMFIQRGWPSRARPHLDQALEQSPDDSELAELRDELGKPVPSVEDTAPNAVSLALVLPVAESHLSQGNRLKGQKLLERLHRAHPDDQRVSDLLWALEGGWSSEEADLTELVAASVPPAGFTPSLLDFPDDDDGEPTVIEAPNVLVDEPIEEDSGEFAFPALFRNSMPPGDHHGETPVSPERSPPAASDVTQSTNLADLVALRDAVGAARRAAGVVMGEEFTEIRRVIRHSDGSTLLDDDDSPPPAIDTSALDDLPFRRLQPDLTPAPRERVTSVGVEAEDDSLIIVTQREREVTRSHRIQRDAATPAHPDAARFLAEAAELERQEQLEAEQRRRREQHQAEVQAARAARRGRAPLGLTTGWLLAMGLLFLCAVLMGTALIAVYTAF